MLPLLHAAADAVIKRMYRSPLYYGRFNNTLSFHINRAYVRYANECAALYTSGHPTETLDPSPFQTMAATCLHGVFPADRAKAFSAQITDMISRKDPCILQTESDGTLQVRIRRPLQTLGTDVLDVLRSPVVDRALRSFFQGYYRIETVGASRSLPSSERTSSWLWHSDSFPPFTCKLFLHLTPANAERGATEFMSLADTMAYRRAGYFGQFREERCASLEEFAHTHNLPYRPYHCDAEPGDATLFNMNFFHRAVAPVSAFRDIVSFYFLPSPIPWDEHFKCYGEALLLDTKKSGFPKDPRLEAEAATVQGMNP